MKKLIIVIVCLLCIAVASAQELQSPVSGKALVYFARSSGTGALINFKYFDGDQYLGKFSGLNYFLYECDPGEHLFWVAAENRDFVKADLLADKVYIIQVIPTMGAFKAAVKLNPVSKSDLKAMKKVNKLLSKKGPIVLDKSKAETEAAKLDFFIKNGLEKYDRDQEKGKVIKQLKAEMYHN
ncbi:MAG: hypothetical protein AAF519_06075 [Bacteroidota bacterium]